MHIRLTDFGTGLIVEDNEISQTENGEKKTLRRTNSFVGTVQFVAPEILQHAPIHYGFVRYFKYSKNIFLFQI
jgi:serine/threonine protein kinase